MTIDYRTPRSAEEPRLRELFTEAFGDAGFTDLFFRTGFSPERCLAAFDTDLLAALHWFDCTLDGKKSAYIYGIAAFEACRGKGVGSALIRHAIDHLRNLGYEVLLLVPAEPSLFGYYERFGFRSISSIREFTAEASRPLPIRKLSASEYAALRRTYLPPRSLIQEGPCLALLSGYASFFATAHAVAAVTDSMVWEFLGDEAEIPGLLAALNLPKATLRTPGNTRPFAMGMGADGPIYLGLALD